MQNELQQIYDRFADTYEMNRGLFDMSGVIADFFQRLPRRPGLLLDLGCGAGEPFPAYFIGQGWQVVGVDFSARMLTLAHHYLPGMKTIFADIRDVNFPEEQFDAVTAIYCLFHIEHATHAELFRKMFHWLKPGGKSLFTYATKEYTGREEFNGYKEFMGEKLFYSHMTPDDLLATLKSTGFTIEATQYRRIGGETFLWITVARPSLFPV
ncbi:MAG: methyltransferase domain-containing protein [Deltaproteobacteria bacterium]